MMVCGNRSGQAVVEFTLVFILFLIIAWIPADFGLALYTGQLAQNASREGARIAAATKTPDVGSCVLPCLGTGGIREATAVRMSSALLPGGTVTVAIDPGTSCDAMVTVEVSGNYNFFFYRLLGLLGFSVDSASPITRTTSMRLEHQC